MLSQTVEYALRAMVFLASKPDSSHTAVGIAKATKVPQAYLSKIMQNLSREGLVRSQRGLNGGFTLALSAEDLSVLQVVSAVDPIQRIRTCPLGLSSHGKALCPLHSRLDKVLEEVEKAFGNTTLAEILNEPTTSVPLCDFPTKLADHRAH